MAKQPVALRWSDWAEEPEVWEGTVDGTQTGTDLTLIFYSTDKVGAGKVWTTPVSSATRIRTGEVGVDAL